jgi:hypothetical protein
MKTAMQELMNELDDIVTESTKKKWIEKEKEQIIDAYYGKIDGVYGYREAGEEYYNQTYNQKK